MTIDEQNLLLKAEGAIKDNQLEKAAEYLDQILKTNPANDTVCCPQLSRQK